MVKKEQRRIQLGGKEVEYLLRNSRRARRLAVAIRCGGGMVVTKPNCLAESRVEDFLRSKADWIIEKINLQSKNKEGSLWVMGRKEYLNFKEQARQIAEKKVAFFNSIYNFRVNGIRIKDQRSRWASCSRAGNLNFNFRIALIDDHLADYLVVHELCHLGQMNHSRKFWELVAIVLPDYADRRRELRDRYK